MEMNEPKERTNERMNERKYAYKVSKSWSMFNCFLPCRCVVGDVCFIHVVDETLWLTILLLLLSLPLYHCDGVPLEWEAFVNDELTVVFNALHLFEQFDNFSKW